METRIKKQIEYVVGHEYFDMDDDFVNDIRLDNNELAELMENVENDTGVVINYFQAENITTPNKLVDFILEHEK